MVLPVPAVKRRFIADLGILSRGAGTPFGNARGVILDVSGVEIIDSYITRILNDIGKSVRFMGAECFIVGIRPAVAMTLIEMGVELDSVHTALNLDLAMERLELLQ